MNKLNLNMLLADFSPLTPLTPELMAHRRERIMQLQDAMLNTPGTLGENEINEGNLEHFFATGVYGRKLFIPKGNLIVSKIHRGKTLNVIVEGVISVISEHGYHTYIAPHIFVSNPFTKRVVIALEDTTWLTAHGSHQTDLAKVEDEIIAKDFAELEGAV